MSNANYTDVSYWDSRYLQQPFTFDWLEDYESLKNYLSQHLTSSSSVLNVGCGSSELSERLYLDMKVKDIVNIDYSQAVLAFMAERTKHLVGMKWMLMNATQLQFDANSFDVVIDKCTSDTLYCDDKPNTLIAIYYREISKVLKQGGVFILITHGDEAQRLSQLEFKHLHFDIQVIKLTQELPSDGFGNKTIKEDYMYICRKTSDEIIGNEEFNKLINELQSREETIEINNE